MTNKPGPESAQIRRMFDTLAPRYDIFNQLMAMGLARSWRSKALSVLRPGMKVLDLGCGTGDLSIQAAAVLGKDGEVTAIDFSEKMIEFGKRRLEKALSSGVRHAPVRFILKKAEELPMEEGYYDLVVSGFVLRNIYENIGSILQGVRRSLKEGGRISFLDLTEPANPLIRALWWLYMNTVAALYGKVLFGGDYPVLYLTESANRFLKPRDFRERLKAAGFKEIETRTLMLGTIVLYQAVK